MLQYQEQKKPCIYEQKWVKFNHKYLIPIFVNFKLIVKRH